MKLGSTHPTRRRVFVIGVVVAVLVAVVAAYWSWRPGTSGTDPSAQGQVATVAITTRGGTPIPGKDEAQGQYTDATAVITSTDGTSTTHPIRIRVRGNSTAQIVAKPPFKVKFESPTAVLGMPADTDWVLLANYFDRSLLRNDVAMEAARRLGVAWAPRLVPAEVSLDGTLLGLYQFGEGIEVGPDRVDLPAGAELLEADFHEDDDPRFTTRRNLRVFVTSTKDDAVRDRVAAQFQQIEDLLYADDFPENGYRDRIDADSWARAYLVNELTKNHDSAFMSSIFMVMDADGTLSAGPPWDFDLSMGNRKPWGNDQPTGWFLNADNYVDNDDAGWRQMFSPSQIWDEPRGHYWNRLMADPWFVARVQAIWQESADDLADLDTWVDERISVIDAAAVRNFSPEGAGHPVYASFLETDEQNYVFHNPVPADPNAPFDVESAWLAEARAVATWLTTRVAWLSEELPRLTSR